MRLLPNFFRTFSKISVRIILYINQNIIHITETKITSINCFFKIYWNTNKTGSKWKNYTESLICLFVHSIQCAASVPGSLVFDYEQPILCYLLTNHVLPVTSYFHRRRVISCHISQIQSCSSPNYTCSYSFLFLHYLTTLWRHGALVTEWQSTQFLIS